MQDADRQRAVAELMRMTKLEIQAILHRQMTTITNTIAQNMGGDNEALYLCYYELERQYNHLVMQDYHAEYEEIMHMTDIYARDLELGKLMTKIEKCFKIPMQPDAEHFQSHKDLYKFYLLVSSSRDFDAYE